MRSRKAKVLHRAGGKALVEHVVETALALTTPERVFVVVGRRGLAKGVVEASERVDGTEHELPVELAGERALALLQGEDA